MFRREPRRNQARRRHDRMLRALNHTEEYT